MMLNTKIINSRRYNVFHAITSYHLINDLFMGTTSYVLRRKHYMLVIHGFNTDKYWLLCESPRVLSKKEQLYSNNHLASLSQSNPALIRTAPQSPAWIVYSALRKIMLSYAQKTRGSLFFTAVYCKLNNVPDP